MFSGAGTVEEPGDQPDDATRGCHGHQNQQRAQSEAPVVRHPQCRFSKRHQRRGPHRGTPEVADPSEYGGQYELGGGEHPVELLGRYLPVEQSREAAGQARQRAEITKAAH